MLHGAASAEALTRSSGRLGNNSKAVAKRWLDDTWRKACSVAVRDRLAPGGPARVLLVYGAARVRTRQQQMFAAMRCTYACKGDCQALHGKCFRFLEKMSVEKMS